MTEQSSNKSKVKPKGPLPDQSVSKPKKEALKLEADAAHETGKKREKLIEEAKTKAA